MSQSAPRKFSEKIAILERKQNEEEELFHAVMRDVKAITGTTPGTNAATTKSPVGSPNPSSGTAAIGNQNHNIPPDNFGIRQNSPGTSMMVPQPPMYQQQESGDALSPGGMNWSRPSGSLPNVYAMAQQQAMMAGGGWGAYWASPGGAPVSPTHTRTRSPNSHYHPYSIQNTRPGAVSAARQDEKMMVQMMDPTQQRPNMLLQPPNPQWAKTRSDPSIHSNVVNMTAATQNGVFFQPNPNINNNVNYFWPQQQSYRPIQQQEMISHSPQLPHGGGNFMPTSCGVPTQGGQQQFIQQQQQSANPQLPAAGGGAYVRANPTAPPPYNMANNNDVISIVGSLPNMHASPLPPHIQHQQQHNYPSSASAYSIPENREFVVGNNNPQNNSQQQQQQNPTSHQSQQHQQLSTPTLYAQSSQSAPNSPAQLKEVPSPMRKQQWMYTRHYSASPEMLEVPNICVTGADGNESLDCFQDLKDLHLDNEIQRLLHDSPDDQCVDPLTETQLLS